MVSMGTSYLRFRGAEEEEDDDDDEEEEDEAMAPGEEEEERAWSEKGPNAFFSVRGETGMPSELPVVRNSRIASMDGTGSPREW